MKSETMIRAKLAQMQDLFIDYLTKLGFSAEAAELYRNKPELALEGRRRPTSSETLPIVMEALTVMGAILALQDILGER